jgi:16S rRNA (cytosine967-C5)-methyltransferase
LLTNEGINTYTDEAFPDALLLQENLPVFQTSAFQDGLFEVQDAASQCVAPFLQPKAGQRVIDACAGTGGKTLHVASLMNNKGRLLGMDVAEWRLEELRKRARRAGVHNMETRVIDSVKTIRKLNGTADCLLLDVPCSGLGVLKRNPDAKWKLKPDYINKLITIQQQLLRDYAWMTKPGGILVYSTCSILPAENHDQVAAFMNAHPNAFEIIEEKSLLPSQGFDGFYMARLKRLV